jgi:hypothetical protein
MAQQRIAEIDRRLGEIEEEKRKATLEQLILVLAEERLELTKERRALATSGRFLMSLFTSFPKEFLNHHIFISISISICSYNF